MEHTLRCNVLKCRKELNDHAVVTTCSHVFCIECANQVQLSGQREGLRPVCPACDVLLTNPDDVVVTNLNPTEDYKTSVLSGLSPNVIMECAGRALSWWAYQTSQEIVYQEYLAKNLTEKYASLNVHVDKVVNDANSQLQNLNNKVSSLQIDQDALQRKNDELVQALREKSRKALQVQELYDKLKCRTMLGQVQNAASDAVDDAVLASVAANRYIDKIDGQNQYLPLTTGYNHQQSNSHQATPAVRRDMGPPSFRGSRVDNGWAGFSSQGSVQQTQPIQTPSTHRQRLAPRNSPISRLETSNIQFNGVASTPAPTNRTSPRQPFTNINNNASARSSFAGYGMSAGLKVSKVQNAAPAGGRAAVRSKVQHPVAGFSNAHGSAFNPSQAPNMFSNGSNYY